MKGHARYQGKAFRVVVEGWPLDGLGFLQSGHRLGSSLAVLGRPITNPQAGPALYVARVHHDE